MKTVISTSEAPTAVGPYSKGIAPGQFVFCSGPIPLEPETGPSPKATFLIERGECSKTSRRSFAPMLGMETAVKRTVSFTDLSKFGEMNMADRMYFPSDPPYLAQQSGSQLCRRVLR
ncbi:MAG: reactive intermediate/imine deaminase [Verrucomicrobia bacterium]|nr:reactive intermediate/imine deaminase [Verrucomicrobiota bacterium]